MQSISNSRLNLPCVVLIVVSLIMLPACSGPANDLQQTAIQHIQQLYGQRAIVTISASKQLKVAPRRANNGVSEAWCFSMHIMNRDFERFETVIVYRLNGPRIFPAGLTPDACDDIDTLT